MIITEEADMDKSSIVFCLKKGMNEQATCNLIDDFELLIAALVRVAESLKMCENQHLGDLGYRQISFISHRYLMLHRVEEYKVLADNILYEL